MGSGGRRSTDGRRRPRHIPYDTGRHFKLSYHDALFVRELYKIGREGVPRPLTAQEIADKFGVSHMTIRRVVEMDEAQLKMRLAIEQRKAAREGSPPNRLAEPANDTHRALVAIEG